MGASLYCTRGKVMSRHEVPAMVVGAGINGLGVARSLARARVPVWLLDSDARKPEMQTRAARSLQIRGLHGEALVESLEQLGKGRFAGLRPVLLLTQEESVKTISRHRERLTPFYRFSLPHNDIVDALLHKYGFQHLAELHDAPIPKLVRVTTPADLSELEHLRYPAVVKPGERHAGYSRQFKKAYRVGSVAETRDLVRSILAVMPDVVVQEWIAGPDSNIHFCLQYLDRESRAVASFTGRKIRSWPPEVGGTASCTAAPEVHAELSAITARFFRETGVTGMAGMEYKRDSHTGAMRMVEPTIGRTDFETEVATLNGVNLPFAAYCSELGLPTPPTATTRSPAVWRVRPEDTQSALLQHQRSGSGFPSGSRTVDALWRWSDPMPLLVQGLHRIRRKLRKRLTRSAAQPSVMEAKP